MLPRVSSSLLAFRARRPEPAVLLRRGDVDPLTWAGMFRDGLLRPLWVDVAVRSGAPVTPRVRLAAIGQLAPPRAVVARAAAAWVHAGGAVPAVVDVLVASRGRRADPHPLRRACEGSLAAADVVDLPEGRVTSVQRTGLDVARFVVPDEAARLLPALLPLGFDPAEALDALDALAGCRGSRRARALLAALRRG